MALDLTLLAVFLASFGGAGVLVWRKIPLLLQVPQQLIEESFVTRPSRLKRLVEAVARFFREQRYYDLWYTTALWALNLIRVRLLRMERSVYHLASILEAKSRDFAEERQRYWENLKGFKTDTRLVSDAPAEPKSARAEVAISPIAPPVEAAAAEAVSVLVPSRIERTLQSTVIARPKRLRVRSASGMGDADAANPKPRRMSKKKTAAVSESDISIA
ncbi:hypothetical protein C4552_02395 [Candidatus Parcubacteria bacterium]|nr:MAG: hypothetical protein C4552_02395 [Candidatus Parcubacteria bacterium]